MGEPMWNRIWASSSRTSRGLWCDLRALDAETIQMAKIASQKSSDESSPTRLSLWGASRPT